MIPAELLLHVLVSGHGTLVSVCAAVARRLSLAGPPWHADCLWLRRRGTPIVSGWTAVARRLSLAAPPWHADCLWLDRRGTPIVSGWTAVARRLSLAGPPWHADCLRLSTISLILSHKCLSIFILFLEMICSRDWLRGVSHIIRAFRISFC